MGQSTDAILFYGVLVGDEGEAPWYIDENGDPPDSDQETPTDVAERLLEEAGIRRVTVGIHCSYSAPMYYLAATEHTAWRGSGVEIKNLDVLGLWDKRLEKACEVLGVKKPKIGWFLVSFWEV